MEKVHLEIINRTKLLLVLIIMILGKNTMFSQSFESLKTSDTIYIYFDNTKQNSIKYPDGNRDTIEFFKNYITYEFKLNPLNTIFFISNTFKNTDDMTKNIKNDEKIEKKSFLRKNKNVILDIDFFHKNGFKETYIAIYQKIIYLIDKDDIKGRKIKVKQVTIRNHTYHEL